MNTQIIPLVCFISLFIFSGHLSAKDTPDSNENTKVSVYALSESYSNILPIKQLIDDEWKQAPSGDSSHAFTQNEFGIRIHWNDFIFDVAHRLDYFVSSNSDTAEAFYLERSDQPLTTKNEYEVDLQLLHQQSSGVRLGYKFNFDSIETIISLGYWNVISTRDSYLRGRISGNDNNDLNAEAELKEFYSDKNFLKRTNTNDWETDGYGITVDVSLHWKINKQFTVNLDIKDLYSKYTFKNLGFSQGTIDSDGTFVNSLGGQSYLPLYRGVEGSKDYQFELPEQINLVAMYNPKNLSKLLSFLTRYKRQGDVNFYYLGTQWQHSELSQTSVMFDMENLSPEIQYSSNWLTLKLAIDELNYEKAKQLSFGLSLNTSF